MSGSHTYAGDWAVRCPTSCTHQPAYSETWAGRPTRRGVPVDGRGWVGRVTVHRQAGHRRAVVELEADEGFVSSPAAPDLLPLIGLLHIRARCLLARTAPQQRCDTAGSASIPGRDIELQMAATASTASGETLEGWNRRLEEVLQWAGEQAWSAAGAGVDGGLVEVCDDQGTALCCATRRLAVRLRFMMRGVGMAVVTCPTASAALQGLPAPQPPMWLVHQRASTRTLFAEMWDMFVGGLCEPREDPEEAAKRELKEEMGLGDGGQWRPLLAVVVHTRHNQVYVHCYAYTPTMTEAHHLQTQATTPGASVPWQAEEVTVAAFVPGEDVRAAVAAGRAAAFDQCWWSSRLPHIDGYAEHFDGASGPDATPWPATRLLRRAAPARASAAAVLFVPDGMAVWDALGTAGHLPAA